MIDCLKLNDNSYLVTYFDGKVEIVNPKNKEERELLEKRAEFADIHKDLLLCNGLIYNITSDVSYHNGELKNSIFAGVNTFIIVSALSSFLHLFYSSFSLKESVIFNCVVILAFEAFDVAKYVDYLVENNNKNNLYLLKESKEKIEQRFYKKKNELETAICNLKNNHNKRKVEEFFYTDSDLKQIETNIVKSKKHPE